MHPRQSDRRALRAALALTAGYCGVEAVGGLLTHSLALLSDAVHMLADVAALSLGLFALWVAGRSASNRKTYGYYRAEILGALFNGLGLWLAVVWIVVAAVRRLQQPEPVEGGAMMGVAAAGLLVNVVCAWLLLPGEEASLNRRAAFLHVLGDLLGSIGAMAAGVIIVLTGWYGADAVAACFIAALIVAGSYGLMREATDILMEAAPSHIEVEQLRHAMEAVAGVEQIHDLHVWTLTTGQHALSAHVVVDGTVDGEEAREALQELLSGRFDVDHVTLQVERTRPCSPATVHA